ncbi:uncharacterized protein LOC121377512 [Gigantopelta aegis]|uniref:uncharacterized protein LOC121377512 n=1 Tax=Gigantopelta aegis TaxID=1735272 RepID=UPI001B88C533|nr:uncharacterized protein LOC121377512 [Gigantopelta aegis]
MASDSALGCSMTVYQPPHHCRPTIGKFIKKKVFSQDNKPIYKCRKVWREDGGRVEEWRHANLWQELYTRHQDNLSRGFFTPFAHQYRATGEVILDTKELLFQTLENSMVTKKYQIHSFIPESEQEAVPPVEEPSKFPELIDIADNDERSDGGMEKIQQAIKRSRNRIRDVKAGKIYDSTFFEEKKPVEELEPTMVLISLSDLDLLCTIHTQLEPLEQGEAAVEMAGASSSKESVSSQEQSEENASDETSPDEANLTVQFDETDLAIPTLKQFDPAFETLAMKERLKRDQMHFLQCIYDIIILLRNINNRHLRNKKPIPRRILRELKKTYMSRHTQIRFSKMQSQRLSGGDPSSSSTLDNSRRDNARPSVFCGPPKCRRSIHFIGAGSKEKQSHKSCSADQPVKIETWDDLVSTSVQSDLTVGQSQTQIQYSTLRAMARGSMHRNISESPEEKGLPIWLKIASEKSTSVVDKGKPKPDNRIRIVENAQINFNKIKQNEAREVENELSSLERERFMKFKVKLQCFDYLHSGELLAQRQQKMEEEANFITSCPDAEIPPSKWFEELKERTLAIVGKDDSEVNAQLAKVGGYSAMSPKTVNYCKAKLCLLVMSLPAYELLCISMQLALKFVLEKILLGEAKQLVQWIMLRKLPFVIIQHHL